MTSKLLNRGMGVAFCLILSAKVAWGAPAYLAPQSIISSPDGKMLYIAETAAKRIDVFDTEKRQTVASLACPGAPGKIALSANGKTLYVLRSEPDGAVWVIDLNTRKIQRTLAVGHTPSAIVPSHDGNRLYVCNQFQHDVSVVDLETGKEIQRIPVRREPVGAALTPDGKHLLVANLLPTGPADDAYSAAEVSIIDTKSNKLVRNVPLPNGSHSLYGICVSPDGKWAYITHILGRYHLPTTQLERGWMNTNALTIIDLKTLTYLNTVLLDEPTRGAANPWGVDTTADGQTLCVTHAGTHEISIIDTPRLHQKLDRLRRGDVPPGASQKPGDVPNDLAFLSGLRERVALNGLGPRGLVVANQNAWITGFYSDTLERVRLGDHHARTPRRFRLGPPPRMDSVRKGDFYFHDASRCFQEWQSCLSCHPGIRADALNWDLLNDGIGNPKQTKSLLLSHRTPPAMITGIRDKAEIAVRSGIRYIQFASWPETDACAVDEYLKSLKPTSSPHRVDGRFSKQAERGRIIFQKANCVSCHPPPLYTDQKTHNLGRGKGLDKDRQFDTPTLIEVWRTAPYLYDGRSATLKDLFTGQNPDNQHGATSNLSPKELDDLLEFVLSL